MADIYHNHLNNKTEDAIENAKRSLEEAINHDAEYTHNPVTHMHRLIEELQNLRDFR